MDICTASRQEYLGEIPGGHREIDEDIDITASRELYEETGAIKYEIEPVCEYSVTKGDVTNFGRLFYSQVSELGQLPGSEIKEIRFMKNMPENLTYPDIQPQLHEKVLEHLREKAKKIFSWCHDCEIRRCCMDNKNDCIQCAEFSCEIINNSPDPKIKERIESLREGKQ